MTAMCLTTFLSTTSTSHHGIVGSSHTPIILTRRYIIWTFLVGVILLQFPALYAADAPYFSSLFDAKGGGSMSQDADGALVSPIVNREIQVSVAAHSWPSSPHNVICEAWAMVQDYNFLDQWVAELQQQDEEKNNLDYRQLTKRAVQIAAHTKTTTVYPPLMEYALVLRASSPTCELHRGLAQDTLKQFHILSSTIPKSDPVDETEQTCKNDMGIADINAFAVVYPGGKLALTIDELVVPEKSEGSETAAMNLSRDVLLPDEVPRTPVNNDSSRDDLLAILYANMADPAFALFYQRLVELDLPFVVRHMGDVADGNSSDGENVCSSPGDTATPLSSPTILQGYGVRLDIRNVEYKVFDDRKQVDADVELVNVSALEDLTPHFLAGVNISALPKEQAQLDGNEGASDDEAQASSYLKLQERLWKLHVEHELHTKLVPPSWQRRQLSLQAASSIVTESSKKNQQASSSSTKASSSDDPLVLLQDISQNLPSVASTLVHVEVDPDVQGIANELEQVLQSMIRSGGGGFWVNGRPVGIERPSFNVFELIKLFQSEQEQLDRLETSLGPILAGSPLAADGSHTIHTEESVAALKAIQEAWTQGSAFFESLDAANDMVDDDDEDDDSGSSSSSGKFRIDVGRGWKQAVLYVNDIEKDIMYQDWPRSMQQMLMAMQYGMPPRVRRNLFTILAVVDPASRKDGEDPSPGKQLASQLMQNQFPVRLGLLVVSDADIDACAEWVSATKPDKDEPCPMREPDSFLDFKRETTSSIPTTEQLQQMPATARVVHRLLALMASEHPSHYVQAYQEYLTSSIGQTLQQKRADVDRLNVSELVRVHVQLLQALKIVEHISVSEVVRALLDMEEENRETIGDSDPKNLAYAKAVRFAVDKGLKSGMSFLNGIPLPDSSDETAEEKLGELFMEEQGSIFNMVMKGEITDSTPRSIYAKLLSGGKVFPRVHPLLSDTSSENRYMEVNHKVGPNSLLFVTPNEGEPASSTPPATADVDAVFVIDAVLEFDTQVGLEIASKLVSMLDSFPATLGKDNVAIGYRILPSTEAAAKSPLCPLLAALGRVGSSQIQDLLSKAGNGEDVSKYVNSLGLTIDDREACEAASHSREDLPYANFLVANGRVLPIPDSSLDTADVDLLLTIDVGRSKTVSRLLKPYLASPDIAFDAISRTTSFLSVATLDAKERRSSPLADLKSIEKQVGLEVNNPLRFSWNLSEGKPDRALKMDVLAIVDPVTETAQRLSPLLRVIRDQLHLPLTLILAPRTVLDADAKIPITSYYRFVADPSAYQGSELSPMAHFENLPTSHTLTLRMDIPEPWNIQQTQAIQDTDNLRCDLISGCSDTDHISLGKNDDRGEALHAKRHITHVEYGLNSLMFFGQCYQANGSPPNGLQLTLTRNADLKLEHSADHPATAEINSDGSIDMDNRQAIASSSEPERYSDTLVMKNVGYWQLRANPGVWDLNIDKNSRGSEIFDMVDGTLGRGYVRLTGTEASNSTKRLVMKDFVSRSELLLVKRRRGWEKASLFYDNKQDDDEDDEVINVFSLATGHLYERFLKIMMLSVTKRTSSKVKFWLFENFLSPTFKSSAIAMAKSIGCEVEFVTYKWPEWLRGQSEKQRIIWGYKILFLDVLFPLNVKKIIYVDADQVVRGDLKELWDMDLNGAPYGYTPFCTSRETTLGFQFWNTGFWESHLRGKPYHISALYVVDLARFRKTLVGDQLRSIYQQLSADPGSLANLDQDLPNYAQHQVPIFSLPQEWLWCETWCSDDTKAASKTIDLCNNPLHKEPKVSMAKRIISGNLFNESWVELDGEVEMYEKEYLESL